MINEEVYFMRKDGMSQRAYKGVVREILRRRKDGRPTYLVEVEGYEKLLEVACEKIERVEVFFKQDVEFKIWQYERNIEKLKRDLDKLNLKNTIC
ncbi:MAG: hypothetical protein ACRCXA_03925 [Peptostreptococcaceae bacterium]